MTPLEKAGILKKKGWKETTSINAWKWYHPSMPAAFYRLEDAFEIVSREKK